MECVWPKDGDLSQCKSDLVLIHGLAEDADSTWRHENGKFWPSDFLPHDVPGMRILTYSHDADSAFVEQADEELVSLSRISTIAENLCGDLLDNRIENDTPITFICHGIGGTILARALQLSHARSIYGRILTATHHVIFMDTPHHGFDDKAWAGIHGQTLNARGIQQLREWSAELTDLRKSFVDVASRFSITTYYSMKAESGHSNNQVAIREDSAVLAISTERPRVLDHESHSTMCKFESREATTYKVLMNRIRAANHEREMKDTAEAKQRLHKAIKSIRDKLNTNHRVDNSGNHEAYHGSLRKRTPETCEWIFEHPKFKRWIAGGVGSDGRDRSLLWLFGSVGCGKTTLCSATIDHVRSKLRMPAIYIYLHHNTNASMMQLLEEIADQILDNVDDRTELHSSSSLTLETIKFLGQSGSSPDHIETLIRQLLPVIGPAYFFLDGLNEVQGSYLKSAKRVVQFLERIVQKGNILRLWCSSQSLESVSDSMANFEPFQVDTVAVEKDVLKFLMDKMSNQITTTKRDLKKVLQSFIHAGFKAGSNFLWASLMMDDIAACVRDDLMLNKIRRGLPQGINEFYQGQLERLERQDDEEWNEEVRYSASGGEMRQFSLNRTILSILSFSKRHLSFEELQEALSIVRNQDKPCGRNGIQDVPIDRYTLPKLQTRCRPLVEFHSSRPDSDKGYFAFSHGSVWTFMRECWRRNEVDKGDRTPRCPDPKVLAQACLSYLFQARYSHQSIKWPVVDFAARWNESIEQHHLLRYCATYWYRHLEESPTEDMKWMAQEFLQSSQFLACLQVQSHFVLGHFYHDLDNRSKDKRLVKKGLPGWMAETAKSLSQSYYHFVAEWGAFLHRGAMLTNNGEVDRCFWGSLGPRNLLSCHKSAERYQSFEIYHHPLDQPNKESVFCDSISDDGLEVLVVRVNSKGSKSEVQGVFQSFKLDGNNDPTLRQSSKASIPRSQARLHLYNLGNLTKYPLIPISRSLVLPDAIGGVLSSGRVRVGSALVRLSELSSQDLLKFQETTANIFCEDIVIRAQYVIKVRRRRFRPMTGLRKSKPSSMIKRIPRKQLSHTGNDFSDDIFSISDEFIAPMDRSSSDELSSLSSENSGDCTSPEEYCSDDPSDSNDDDGFSEESADRDEDSIRSEASDSADEALSEEQGSDGLAEYNMSNGEEKCNSSDEWSCSEDESSEDQLEKDMDQKEKSADNEDVDGSARGPELQRESELALEKLHPCPDQLLLVEKVDKTGCSTVFKFRSRETTYLHASPPVCCPERHLVVWPLGTKGILYADVEHNSFFTRPLPALPHMRHRISVQPHFSPCGNFLDIASFECLQESEFPPPYKQPPSGKNRMLVVISILSYQLDESQRASNPPKLIFKRNQSLGITDQSETTKLPFQLTWCSEHVYVTTNLKKMQIYRIPLSRPNNHDSQSQPVTIPEKNIVLPRSARNRVVRFFPNLNGGRSLLFIGSRQDRVSSPPIGVYLQDSHLGTWKPVNESPGLEEEEVIREESSLELLHLLELDLIPFDPDIEC